MPAAKSPRTYPRHPPSLLILNSSSPAPLQPPSGGGASPIKGSSTMGSPAPARPETSLGQRWSQAQQRTANPKVPPTSSQRGAQPATNDGDTQKQPRSPSDASQAAPKQLLGRGRSPSSSQKERPLTGRSLTGLQAPPPGRQGGIALPSQAMQYVTEGLPPQEHRRRRQRDLALLSSRMQMMDTRVAELLKLAQQRCVHARLLSADSPPASACMGLDDALLDRKASATCILSLGPCGNAGAVV